MPLVKRNTQEETIKKNKSRQLALDCSGFEMPDSSELNPSKNDGDAYELRVRNDDNSFSSIDAVGVGSSYITFDTTDDDRAEFIFDLSDIWSSGIEQSAIVEFRTSDDKKQIVAKAIRDGDNVSITFTCVDPVVTFETSTIIPTDQLRIFASTTGAIVLPSVTTENLTNVVHKLLRVPK